MATHVVAVVDGVALRKESVDRNNIYIAAFIDVPRVALRKESVDRNFGVFAIAVGFLESLSARRAWIEIGCWLPDHSWWLVALRKESVDRNARKIRPVAPDICRSPQGERG